MQNIFFEKISKNKIVSFILAILVAWLIISLSSSIATLFFLKQKHIRAASYSAGISLPLAKLLSFTTMRSNATIETWLASYTIITKLPTLTQGITPQTSLESLSIKKIAQFITDNQTDIDTLLSKSPESPFIQKLLDPPLLSLMQTIQPKLPVITDYLQTISTGNHTWVVLFQNSEELRANGGFLGSYALVNLQDGVVAEIVIEDVYDADGQFTGFIPAPYGVNEYLSSNNGLRLPDANWFADFPTSAQTIMQFFAFSNKRSLDGVIAINLETLQEVVKLVEPLWLPDYETHVTAENLSYILREKRGTFFPGSQDKKQLLKAVWNQLKITLTSVDATTQKQLVSVIISELRNKNIQLFSIEPTIQTAFSETGFAGTLTTKPHFFLDEHIPCLGQRYPTCPTDYFYLVESNVGVNKANRLIARAATFSLEQYRSIVSFTITNHNTQPTVEELASRKSAGADHNAYVNYQRIVVPSDYTIHSISVNNKPIEDFDETQLTTKEGENFKEIGFLVAVKEGETQTINAEFSHGLKSQQQRIFTLQKQPGVPPYSVTVSSETTSKQFLLDRDVLLEL